MDMHEIVDRVSAWEGVLAFRPGPGDGSPELSWGDVFFYVAPDGIVPSGQPFATIVTKDYPGEPSSGLDGADAYRVNIAAGDHRRPTGASPSTAPDPSTRDLLMPHPVYGDLGWLAVVNPGERTDERVMALLEGAHAAAWGRWQRRHRTERPSR
ncbi:DUF6194 family protein [Modestobacter sp. VKM Ac-2978]|uniref:DUF6194 family protein n=1 Tax=Modestobacter sp. VKM Ac-2978 TaxID=3004132 RepID=UPI0022AABE52|nr:DUF6194 family protein [Modestobacter sp. VKM Ac-2978]MCZ2850498.1 DUF6194 family protein [Modestobacter sp. VKM Ac-2978]